MEEVKRLYISFAGEEPLSIRALPASGSNRQYYRIEGSQGSVIAVEGSFIAENKAFIAFSNHFRAKGLNVPEVFASSDDGRIYLQQDLGGEDLFSRLSSSRKYVAYSEEDKALLSKVMRALADFQFKGGEGFPTEECFSGQRFDSRMIDFDLNYFKYCYLKAVLKDFDELRLQDDFDRLREDLLRCGDYHFMYRDFQSRNVMVFENEPWFIDFQGGRMGPIYYDLASFLWQAKAQYPQGLRDYLIDVYIDAAGAYAQLPDRSVFLKNLRLFVLFRTLQVLGAYGFRGYFERKPHFLASVPFALENLRDLLVEHLDAYPYLDSVLRRISEAPEPAPASDDNRLVVQVWSFSYRKGIPEDASGNGGGYVFDCRGIHNPGRYDEYKDLCGLDAPVIDFIERGGEAAVFLESVYSLIDTHVDRYVKRSFTSLSIAFGCTGGQHRSVFCAESTAKHLSSRDDIVIRLRHRELGIDKTIR